MTFASRMQHKIYWGPMKKPIEWSLKTVLAPWAYIASVIYHDSFWYPVNAKRHDATRCSTARGDGCSATGKRCSRMRRTGYPDVGSDAAQIEKTGAKALVAVDRHPRHVHQGSAGVRGPQAPRKRARSRDGADRTCRQQLLKADTMSDFTVRSDNVDVEQIMRQIRSRIREKRGVDYTEDEIRELANVKLEKFLDPSGVRSDLLEQYRKRREASTTPRELRVRGHDALRVEPAAAARASASCCKPILKLFFNPNPLVEALHIQSKLNDSFNAGRGALLRADSQPRARDDAARASR